MQRLGFTLIVMVSTFRALAQGEPSTYFNIFVPPNNDPVKRNVCVVVTAIFDDTTFDIVDDGADGDQDDSKSGTLKAGQSYVLYIADNGINDDARYASGGIWKQDGDYFIIHSDKNVLVSQSTNSDWQHDFVPAVGQKGIGEKFIVYAPKTTSSPRDLNTFAYFDSTIVTIKRISTQAITTTGYTGVDYQNAVTIGSQLINRGQDIIYAFNLGRDVMQDGHTYMVEASKPVTLQYGALYGNERDGGANVPSSNGSSSGDLFYFGVPYQSVGEQEIRIVSWDDGNSVTLERYSAGSWIAMKSWSMNRYGVADWVGKSNGNVSYPTVFRLRCTAGKRVSLFEANWLETGSPGTSDIGSMLSSENGTSAGKKFIAYIAPPGNEQNVLDPFTGKLLGQRMSHLYISSRTGATVTIKDAYRNGDDFSRTYTIAPERYIDCAITETDWKNIYNGTGTTAGGPERPYLVVESDQPVSVFNTNFNDNWMSYVGTAQVQSFSVNSMAPPSTYTPGDTVVIRSEIVINGSSDVNDATAFIKVENNLLIVSSTFNSGTTVLQQGTVADNGKTATYSDLPTITSGQTYTFNTAVVASVTNDKGELNLSSNVATLTTAVSGAVDGVMQQSVSSDGILINGSNQSQLQFTHGSDPMWDKLTDSWTVSLVDYNQDGWDDIFIGERDATKPVYLYRNNGNATFSGITSGDLVTAQSVAIGGSWADVDNDGDLDVLVINNTRKPNAFYINNGNGTFTRNNEAGFAQQVGYYHQGTWIDYDADGLLDLFLNQYWPTKLNELWHNDGDGKFSLDTNSELAQIPGNAVSAAWYDYDHDGLPDVFLPNNKGMNALYHNEGRGRFTRVNNIISQEGGFSTAACWGDIDGNGHADLFVANASARDNYLYLNQGQGNFTKVTSGSVVHDGGHSHGCSFADIDNDGDLDLYVNNTQGQQFLYFNDGTGNLSRRINETVTANYGNAIGHAWSDLDRDGDLDLFGVTHSGQKNHLFWNNGNGHHWLQLKLNGVKSNRNAIGARIRAKVAGKWLLRAVCSQTGIGGQDSYRQHFGLGNATTIDSLIIQWPSGLQQTLTALAPDQFMIVTEETGGTVQASFYADANENCAHDAGEIAVPIRVKISPINTIVMADASGKIQATLSPGNYTLTPLNTEQYTSACAGATIPVTITAGATTNLNEVALKPVCQCTDASIQMYTTALRRGFGHDYHVDVKNEGNLPLATTEVKVQLPSQLELTRATPAWNNRTTVGDAVEYTWQLASLAAGDQQQIVFRDSVTLRARIGDELTITGQISSNTASERTLANNTYLDIQTVVGSIDPNMITASPQGSGDAHYLLSTTPITYKIHFENFGNYPTSFITITDSLPTVLNPASVSDIQSSHGPVMTSIHGQVITFYFPHVELPSYYIDSVASKGFVQFHVLPYSGHGNGQFDNRATIYFDYNEPIVTNTVSYTLLDQSQIPVGSLQAFPNPASTSTGYIVLRASAEGEASALSAIQAVNVQGVSITLPYSQHDGVTEVQIDNLKSGLYIIEARDIQGKAFRTKLLVTADR